MSIAEFYYRRDGDFSSQLTAKKATRISPIRYNKDKHLLKISIMYSSAAQAKQEICKMVGNLTDENCHEVLSFMKRIQKIEREMQKHQKGHVKKVA